MPVFAYRAYDQTGRRIQGSLTADTPASGRELLRRRGVRLLAFEPARSAAPHGLRWRPPSQRRQEQAADLARQLSMLLGTGVPLVEALDVLIRQQTRGLAAVLRDVREKVAGGTPFSGALMTHPTWFDAVFCRAVEVGQTSGHMDTSLHELAAYIRDRQTIRARVFTALAYPLIMAVLGTGVVVFLMSYVVPQLLTVLEASGRSLPATTMILKGASDFLTHQWLAIVAAICIALGASAALHRWPPARRFCHSLVLRLPLFGALIRKAIISQFAQIMSLLLRSGVPLIEALFLVRRHTRHLVLQAELARMVEALQQGSDLAPALHESQIFPPLVVHIVNVGQKSGELTEMLSQLKEGYETEVRLAIGKFTAALEPTLIIVMSAVVGLIVFATMTPILEVTRAIQ